MSDTVRDVLTRAGDLVEAGWCQGSYSRIVDGQLRCCAIEAICRAVVHTVEATEARELVCRVVGSASLSGWNDAPERTQVEVVAAFRKAAAL